MKTHRKVILDEWFGKLGVVILNITARFLGAILSINHSLDKSPGRIAVCKFLGMGSIIQATPLLQTLRKNFPSAEIIFITSEGNRSLLESVSCVDKVFCINDKSAWKVISSSFSLLKSLWSKKADLYIDLETYSYYSTAIATLSCATNRFGFYRVERNIRMGVYTHMMFFNARAPIAQSYLQMARLAGCKSVVESLYKFSIRDEVRKAATKKINTLGADISHGAVIINPNASDLRIERRWPQENFLALIKNLRLAYPQKTLILIGAINEQEWVNDIHRQLDEETKKKVINSAGCFSLAELFAVIDSGELIITNDTGPMHISFSLGKPTISLFGPASPAQYGQHSSSFGIYKNIYCSPCVHDFITPPCHGDNQCMKQITVSEVFELCKQILSGNRAEAGIQKANMAYLKKDGTTSLGIVERS
jgi:ADP-heptose:LPS heptosyltransferase